MNPNPTEIDIVRDFSTIPLLTKSQPRQPLDDLV